MFSITNFFIGLFIIAAGVVSLKYNFQLVGLTGSQDWIENRLGGGTTYAAFKLFSLVAILVGFLIMTGLGVPFFSWLLSPLGGLFRTPAA